MSALDWAGRRRIAWPIGAAWVGASIWRFLVGAAEDRDRSYGGVAQREHIGLLLLQGALALFAALAWTAVAMGVREGDRRSTRIAAALLVVLAAGFAAIFLRPGLLDWGGYEN
jgi:SNF family Na+-dependent transporter